MGYTVSFLSHKIGFLCKLLNIFERIWNILLWTQSVDAISLGMPSIALSLAWSDWCLPNVSKIHRPASLAAFHPCYNKILSADKFLRKTWNRFPFILFCCVKDLGYLSCCNNHKQIEHKKIYGKNAHVDKLPQNSAKRWSEHDTDISRSHLRSHNWLRNIFSEILRRQIVKVWEKGAVAKSDQKEASCWNNRREWKQEKEERSA